MQKATTEKKGTFRSKRKEERTTSEVNRMAVRMTVVTRNQSLKCAKREKERRLLSQPVLTYRFETPAYFTSRDKFRRL